MFPVDLVRTFHAWGHATRSNVAHVRSCASRKLPACGLAPLQCGGNLAKGEIEHVVQQKRSPLERRQPVECHEQRNGQVLGKIRSAVGCERCGI